jgi:hypothetical protein
MSGNSLEALRAKVEAMTVDPQSGYGVLKRLILEHDLDEPISSVDVVHRIGEKLGKKWETSRVQTYMAKFMQAGIVQAIKPAASSINF